MYIVSDYVLAKPNWSNPLRYSRKWQTNILTGLKGGEQRSAQFTWPRRSLSYSVLTLGFAEISTLKRVLYKNLHNLLGFPFWQDRTVLSSQADAGQKILSIQSTVNRNFEASSLCVLISPASFEDGVIDSFSDHQIVLQNNLVHTWPQGTEVYPVMIGRVQSSQEINMITSLYGEMPVEVAEDYYGEIVRHIGGDEAFPTYKGSPIFNCRPNWESKINYKLYHPYERLSFLGKSFSMTHYDETAIALKMPYTESSMTTIQKILDFFDSRKGRWGNFWLPTWQEDLIITAPFSISDTILSVLPTDFSSYWLNTTAGSYIIIFWPDWSFVCGKIIDATETTITLESQIGKACPANQFRQLLTCFLLFSRFDQDEIAIDYLTSEIGNIDLSYRGLIEEIVFYTIIASSDGHSDISPMGSTEILSGGKQVYVIAPNEGYLIGDVLVDGVSIGPVSSYEFEDVTVSHTISVESLAVHTIVSSAGSAYGTISPLGSIAVVDGDNQSFTIIPDEDYAVDDVLVDGDSVGAVLTYEFIDVIADHTIVAMFKVPEPKGFRRAFGSPGSGDGQFNFGAGIANQMVYDGEVYVSDYANNRIQVFDPDGTYKRQWAQSAPGPLFGYGGQIYIAKASGTGVHVMDKNGSWIKTIATQDDWVSFCIIAGVMYGVSLNRIFSSETLAGAVLVRVQISGMIASESIRYYNGSLYVSGIGNDWAGIVSILNPADGSVTGTLCHNFDGGAGVPWSSIVLSPHGMYLIFSGSSTLRLYDLSGTLLASTADGISGNAGNVVDYDAGSDEVFLSINADFLIPQIEEISVYGPLV